jgi:hypothetical protein
MRSIISIFCAVGTRTGMDWSPSRAQHSQTTTDSGRGTEDLLGEARVAGTPQRTGADLVSPAVKRMSTINAGSGSR